MYDRDHGRAAGSDLARSKPAAEKRVSESHAAESKSGVSPGLADGCGMCNRDLVTIQDESFADRVLPQTGRDSRMRLALPASGNCGIRLILL